MDSNEAQKAIDAAYAGLREAQADVLVAQARVLEWEAQVLMAKAQHGRLVPTADLQAAPAGGQLSNQELRAAVLKVMRDAARPLTVDDILTRLGSEGVTVAGKRPRENLLAYLSRWEGIATVSRGHYMPFKAEGIGIPGPGSHGGDQP